MNACRGQRGFALIITLVITALLVALVVEFIDDVFVETSGRQYFVNSQQASLMANSGVEAATKLLQLSLSARSNYTTLSDQWAKPIQLEDEKGALLVTIEDENGKLNLNLAANDFGKAEDSFHYKTAVRLFKSQGLSLDLLDALTDWRDLNDDPLPGGAETAQYMQMKPPYKSKNGKLQTFEELSLVRGFNMDTLNNLRLRDSLTVYPLEGYAAQININTAPENVIAALADGMTPALAKSVIDYRKITPFTSPGDLSKVPGLESIAMGLSTNLSVSGTIYRIVSKATVNETTRTVEAVWQNGGAPPFIYWREF